MHNQEYFLNIIFMSHSYSCRMSLLVFIVFFYLNVIMTCSWQYTLLNVNFRGKDFTRCQIYSHFKKILLHLMVRPPTTDWLLYIMIE